MRARSAPTPNEGVAHTGFRRGASFNGKPEAKQPALNPISHPIHPCNVIRSGINADEL
jgi:hypothetical protein